MNEDWHANKVTRDSWWSREDFAPKGGAELVLGRGAMSWPVSGRFTVVFLLLVEMQGTRWLEMKPFVKPFLNSLNLCQAEMEKHGIRKIDLVVFSPACYSSGWVGLMQADASCWGGQPLPFPRSRQGPVLGTSHFGFKPSSRKPHGCLFLSMKVAKGGDFAKASGDRRNTNTWVRPASFKRTGLRMLLYLIQFLFNQKPSRSLSR